MRDKCLNCPDYPYVTDENRDKICYRCDFQDTVCELKRAFEESWIYKFMVKLYWQINQLFYLDFGGRNENNCR